MKALKSEDDVSDVGNVGFREDTPKLPAECSNEMGEAITSAFVIGIPSSPAMYLSKLLSILVLIQHIPDRQQPFLTSFILSFTMINSCT